ncbi:hypothetical protein CDAR_516471 [Caerostris darwini]|uniref:Uncharacterized protein n=1 Tax=Caerostris darwini TaxID=1538125 RepID=A0AAV4WY40_9ARAC|nr:hypothetical protein CDAR_516471 [Caerostris darwini]
MCFRADAFMMMSSPDDSEIRHSKAVFLPIANERTPHSRDAHSSTGKLVQRTSLTPSSFLTSHLETCPRMNVGGAQKRGIWGKQVKKKIKGEYTTDNP